MYFIASKNTISFIIIAFLLIEYSAGENKYSASANKPKKEFSAPKDIKNLRELDKPFRMNKLNLLWVKAVHRLTDPKLQSLFSELKIQDKEELEYKHLKKDGKDQTGLEEARLRKKLLRIMDNYDLSEHFENHANMKDHNPHKLTPPSKNYIVKDVFKDKKLNKLWAKAEAGGFTNEELEALKEEFNHHQDKLDEYYNLMNEIEKGDPNKHENSLDEKHESWNEIDHKETGNDIPKKKLDYLDKTNLLKEKRLDVKSGYDHLEIITAQGPDHKEFIEPKVQGLWRIALDSNFTPEELESLKEELLHYQHRLLKIRKYHVDDALKEARKGKLSDPPKSKDEFNLKKEIRNADKLHSEIESKILRKHTEL